MPTSAKKKYSPGFFETLSLLFLIAGLLTGSLFFISQISQAYAYKGSYDFPIFIYHANMFLTSGQLYIADLVQYYPVSPVYKFPPLLACILIKLIQSGVSESAIYRVCFFIQMVCYIGAVTFCIYYFGKMAGITDRIKRFIFYGLALLFSLTLEPFIETLVPLQLETYTLTLSLLALYFLHKEQPFRAGLMAGLGCMLKIYPLIFVLLFILHRQWLALGGFFVAIVVINIFTISVIGMDSHIFYFTKILPVMMDEYPSEALTNISLAANMRHFYDYYQPYFSLFDEMPIKLLFRIQFLIFLLPVVWLTYVNNKNGNASTGAGRPITLRNSLLLIEFSLFTILILLGLIDSWSNYQLLLLMPVIAFLAVLFSEKKLDWFTLTILIVSCIVLFTTAHPQTRDQIPASYLYQYVVFRSLTSYFIYYAGFRLLCRLSASTTSLSH